MSDGLHLLPAHMLDSMTIAGQLAPYTLTLLTRHSIREQMEGQGLAGYHLPLTTEGRKLAAAWGLHLRRSLPYGEWTASSSPVGRCMETAGLMLSDDPGRIPVRVCELLVEPGSFVLDIHQAGPQFRQLGALQFINGLLRGELAGLKTPQQGVQDILQQLYADQQSGHVQGRLHLVVSHDTIMAVVLSVLHAWRGIEWTHWPHMMEGMFLWFEGHSFDSAILHWIWRGTHQHAPVGQLLEVYQHTAGQ